MREHRQVFDEDDDETETRRRTRLPFWLIVLLRHPRDSLVSLAALAAVAAIIGNGLFLQPGPHPAPMFKVRPISFASGDTTGAVAIPRPRPADAAAARRETVPSARSRIEIISDIQRELARRSFYDGAVDGAYGAKTDAAIRDFEQAAGIRPGSEPNEAFLQTVIRSDVIRARPPAGIASSRSDPIGNMLSPAPAKIIAVQRALSDFGYGPIKPSGIFDADTRASIERFERERKLPVTGQVSDRLVRELAAMTGRPLD